MKAPSADIPVEYVRDRLEVNERGELYWKTRITANPQGWKMFNERFAGKRAGRLNTTGYYVVTIQYEGRLRKVLAHRIVWALTHGYWPTMLLDHINRVKTDNRPSNLRQATPAENSRNRENVRSGFLGAYPTKNGKFKSQVWVNGRIHHLGTFASAEAANAAFLKARHEGVTHV